MAIALAIAVLVALAVDHVFGEPPVRWHPVVWMGNYLGWSGRWVQRHTRQPSPLGAPSTMGAADAMDAVDAMDFKDASDATAFWLGAMSWMAGAALVVALAGLLQFGLLRLAGGAPMTLLAAVFLGLLLKPLFAWALLRKEVIAVERALSGSEGGSLESGRERLRWLVSRDVAALSETQVRESAIETLAENLNDSVVAPVFWFVLLGLPGAALFRFANTADAMWGYPGAYQGRNWQWAGKWAAHADDVLAWLPARLTALLLAIVAGGLPWGHLRTEARRTPSPNSGWPMGAMALVLGVRLGKPGGYVLHANGRDATALDTDRAIAYAGRAVITLACLATGVLLAICWFVSH